MPDSDVYSIYACNMKQILYSFEIILTMYFCNVSMCLSEYRWGSVMNIANWSSGFHYDPIFNTF